MVFKTFQDRFRFLTGGFKDHQSSKDAERHVEGYINQKTERAALRTALETEVEAVWDW